MLFTVVSNTDSAIRMALSIFFLDNLITPFRSGLQKEYVFEMEPDTMTLLLLLLVFRQKHVQWKIKELLVHTFKMVICVCDFYHFQLRILNLLQKWPELEGWVFCANYQHRMLIQASQRCKLL